MEETPHSSQGSCRVTTRKLGRTLAMRAVRAPHIPTLLVLETNSPLSLRIPGTHTAKDSPNLEMKGNMHPVRVLIDMNIQIVSEVVKEAIAVHSIPQGRCLIQIINTTIHHFPCLHLELVVTTTVTLLMWIHCLIHLHHLAWNLMHLGGSIHLCWDRLRHLHTCIRIGKERGGDLLLLAIILTTLCHLDIMVIINMAMLRSHCPQAKGGEN